MKIVYALFAVAFAASATAQILQEEDKRLHFAAGVITRSMSYQFVYSKTQNREKAIAAGVLTSLMAGISKETYDSFQPNNKFDQADLATTVLGGLSVGLTIKLFNKNKNKNEKNFNCPLCGGICNIC